MTKQIIPIELEDGTKAFAEVVAIDGAAEGVRPQQIAPAALRPVMNTISKISREALVAIMNTGATSGSVEFGVQLTVEGGVANVFLISGTGNMTVTLNWDGSGANA